MRIFVAAKPRAKIPKIEQIDNQHFIIAVSEPPIGGQANAAIIKALAAHLVLAPSAVTLIAGFSSKQKVFEV